MSERQKFWTAVPLFLAFVCAGALMITRAVPGIEGTFACILFGFTAGIIGGSLMPLDWHP